jgi:hypothetical protein
MRPGMFVRLLALVSIASGCSDSIGPSSFAGNWARDFTVPGSSFEMDLTAIGSTISGTGNWCAEAGPCGIVAVTGTVAGNAVHLDLSLTATFPQTSGTRVEHFDGRLTLSRSLIGSITIDVPGQPPFVEQVSYHRP